MPDDSYWNYRILKRKGSGGKPYYGLVEVYYEHDEPILWTEKDFVSCDEDEGSDGIVRTLMLMLKDAQKHEVLDEEELNARLREKPDLETLLKEGGTVRAEELKSIFSDKDAVEEFFGEQSDKT